MINENTVRTINREIDKGNRFFYFDIRSMKLVSSSPNNDITVYDSIEIYIPYHTTIEEVILLLKFYNEMR